MRKGEIWLTDLPQIIGREQLGARPALVIANTQTGLIIVAPLTSNLDTLKYSYVLEIGSSNANGLDKRSVALLFQLRAIDKKRMKHKIGDLEERYLKEIDGKLKELLNL